VQRPRKTAPLADGTSLAKKTWPHRSDAARNRDLKRQTPMTPLTAKGNWNIIMGKLKQKFAQLTDNDLQFMEGKEEELVGRIQKRTGQARDKVRTAVKECYEYKPHE
jgi:uncharacterized protein YjbJ (UPF0337 family)